VFVFVDTDARLADDLSSRRGMLGSGEGILISRLASWEPTSTKSFLIFGFSSEQGLG